MGDVTEHGAACAEPLIRPAWVATTCLCREAHADDLLILPHTDAPNRRSAIVRCVACGLRRLSPRPDARHLGSYYGGSYNAFTGRTRSVRKQRAWEFLRDAYTAPRGWRRLLRPAAEWAFDVNVAVPAGTRPRVLEVGCGYGDLLAYLAERGCDVQGVDPDPRASAAGARLGVPIHTGTIESFRCDRASFDVAVLCHSLEHVVDPDSTVACVSRAVRPGGRVVIAVPNGEAAGLAVQGERWMHVSHPLHLWFFDRRNLAALLAGHGFQVDTIYTTSRWHHWTACLHRVCQGHPAAAVETIRIAARSLATRWAGDVLRVSATRIG